LLIGSHLASTGHAAPLGVSLLLAEQQPSGTYFLGLRGSSELTLRSAEATELIWPSRQ
jgi:hypothetical protein